MIYGHRKQSINKDNLNNSSAVYCTDIVLDDSIQHDHQMDINSRNMYDKDYYVNNHSQSPDITEYCDFTNRTKSPLFELSPSEIHLIPRNKINTFKSFRNSTFKLVPTDDLSSCLVKNSNNSNRFIHTPVKNPVTEESVFINRINKKVMLRKITEIATPFLTLDNSYKIKEFQRLLPHPIIDNNEVVTLKSNLSYDNKIYAPKEIYTEPILKQNHSRSNSNNTHDRSQIHIIQEDIDLDNYEKLLERKLLEIKRLKNRTHESSSLLDNNYAEDIKNYHTENNSQKKEKVYESPNYRVNRDNFKLNIENELKNCQSNINTADVTVIKAPIDMESSYDIGNSYIKSKHHNHSNQSNNYSLQSQNNEIEVCLDEKNRFNENEARINNLHIPLFFQCQLSGKKLRFKTRYLNKMSQSMKAFGVRMGVTIISNLEFISPNNQIISEKDTPCLLDLKPNDIIKIRNKL